MVELIDGFSDIANSGAASKKTDSDIAISIGALCIEHEDASDDLKSILSSAKCKEGMDAYLHQFEDGELVKLAEIVSDNGQYINRLRKKFDADAANWVWNKETADQKSVRLFLNIVLLWRAIRSILVLLHLITLCRNGAQSARQSECHICVQKTTGMT